MYSDEISLGGGLRNLSTDPPQPITPSELAEVRARLSELSVKVDAFADQTVSQQPDNVLQALNDGLYVPPLQPTLSSSQW